MDTIKNTNGQNRYGFKISKKISPFVYFSNYVENDLSQYGDYNLSILEETVAER